MSVQRTRLAVFGILLAFLVAFSWGCGDSAKSQGITFGGPYEMKKLADFRFYSDSDNNLSLSQAAKLDGGLFKESIEANNVPHYGDKGQLYNYAVHTGGEILVAVWNDEIDRERLNAVIASEACPRSDFTPAVPKGMMINWFPEDPRPKESQKPESPCWLPAKVGGGLLDALSKHLMLAQGVRTTIDQFNDRWLLHEVEYAGEIIVNVEKCEYSVNEQSGTYQPQDSAEIRQKLAELFAEELQVAPTEVNEHRVKVDSKRTEIPNCQPSA